MATSPKTPRKAPTPTPRATQRTAAPKAAAVPVKEPAVAPAAAATRATVKPSAARKPAAPPPVAKPAARAAAKRAAEPPAQAAARAAGKTASKVASKTAARGAAQAATPAATPAVTPTITLAAAPAAAPAAVTAATRKTRQAATLAAPAAVAAPAPAPQAPTAKARAKPTPAPIRKLGAAAPAKPAATGKPQAGKPQAGKTTPARQAVVAEAPAVKAPTPKAAATQTATAAAKTQAAKTPAAAAPGKTESAAPAKRRPQRKPAQPTAPTVPPARPEAKPAMDDTAQAVLALLLAGTAPTETTRSAAPVAAPLALAAPASAPVAAPAAAPAQTPRVRPAPAPAPIAATPTPTGPAYSRVALLDADQRWLSWLPGHACPPALQQAAAARLDARQHFAPDDDSALPTLQRLAADAGQTLQIDDAVWPHLAAHRDARQRLAALESAYPQGPASAGLVGLLRSPLPLYQAEGALFAVVAGRALIADERGLGKGVQAIAAAALWRRHFGVARVLVLCAASQRSAWQRAWQRFAHDTAADETAAASGSPSRPAAQVMDGGLHQRQALWSTDVGLRILSPEALASDAAHLQHWAPDLIIVDEPQNLGLQPQDWAALQSPQALVLCGAPLAELPELMDALVGWLDTDRLGPLAALHELQAAASRSAALSEPDVERLTTSLSRLMLQRLRADLAGQLPALVHSERLLTLAPGQREAHDHALAEARRLLAGWQRSAYLACADQWRLAQALRTMQQACHRSDPTDPGSALAEATLQALAGQLADWADLADGAAMQVAVLCATPADRTQLAGRLPASPGLALLLPGEPLPAGLDAVLQVGVPWRSRRSPAGLRGQAVAGQQWVYLVALDSLDAGLFDTLAERLDLPRGLGDSTRRDFLQGERLTTWLQAVQSAVSRLPEAQPR